MVFLPRGVRVLKVFVFGICSPQWRFLCGISTLRSPSKVKSVAISAGMVWSMVMWPGVCAVWLCVCVWSMLVMWRAHFLDHAKINTLHACVRVHILFNTKMPVLRNAPDNIAVNGQVVRCCLWSLDNALVFSSIWFAKSIALREWEVLQFTSTSQISNRLKTLKYV